MTAEVQAVQKGPKARDYEIVINGTPHVVDNADVTYGQVAQLAFPGASDPDVTYSVAYRKAHGGSGTLVAGGSVKVKKGTSFNVTPTTRS
ncbi:multiubiquitin domain-containing protein [Cryobacterium aureum]|uniref:multiubiquitin domain-containing protein n=1 Tax=Cryobacterium aureum TaxID=995037 RepID=UPI001374CEE4|nr:multiubiquitin domain-containing protein [Cryobacterium aureum]